MLDICRRTGALWLLTPHGLPTDDPYDEAFRVAQLQLESEEAAFGTAALLAAAGFPRRWPGPFGATHRNASRRTSLTESIASFRNLRAPLLRAALAEVPYISLHLLSCTPLYLPYISPLSPLYLLPSPLYLPYISPPSPLHLPSISPISPLHLPAISPSELRCHCPGYHPQLQPQP